MNFTDDEIETIYTIFKISINALEMKKKHKSKNDILAIEHLRKVNKKIDKYMEGKENGISRKF